MPLSKMKRRLPSAAFAAGLALQVVGWMVIYVCLGVVYLAALDIKPFRYINF
jgi:hypothetical protein